MVRLSLLRARRTDGAPPPFWPAVLLPLAAASLPTAKPEEVGFSSERLQRIHEMVMRRVEARDISGAVTARLIRTMRFPGRRHPGLKYRTEGTCQAK